MSDTKVSVRPYIVGPASTSFVVPVVSGSPVVIGDFQSQAVSINGTSWTWVGMNHSAGIAVCSIITGFAQTFTTVHIDGNLATSVFATAGGGVFYVPVSAATGGAGSIAVVMSGTISDACMVFCVLTNITTSNAPTASASQFTGFPSGTTGLPTGGPISIPTNGIGIVFAQELNSDVMNPVTWHGTHNATSDASITTTGVTPSNRNALAMSYLTGVASMTATCDISGNINLNGACVSWGP